MIKTLIYQHLLALLNYQKIKTLDFKNKKRGPATGPLQKSCLSISQSRLWAHSSLVARFCPTTKAITSGEKNRRLKTQI